MRKSNNEKTITQLAYTDVLDNTLLSASSIDKLELAEILHKSMNRNLWVASAMQAFETMCNTYKSSNFSAKTKAIVEEFLTATIWKNELSDEEASLNSYMLEINQAPSVINSPSPLMISHIGVIQAYTDMFKKMRFYIISEDKDTLHDVEIGIKNFIIELKGVMLNLKHFTKAESIYMTDNISTKVKISNWNDIIDYISYIREIINVIHTDTIVLMMCIYQSVDIKDPAGLNQTISNLQDLLSKIVKNGEQIFDVSQLPDDDSPSDFTDDDF